MGFGGYDTSTREPKTGLVLAYLVTACRSAEGQGYLLTRVQKRGLQKGRIEGCRLRSILKWVRRGDSYTLDEVEAPAFIAIA